MKRLLAILLCWLAFSHPTFAQQVLGGLNLNGIPPANSIGNESQWYIDFASGEVYGPKTSGQWGPGAVFPTIAGGAPIYYLSRPPFNAACDGTTDVTVALTSMLNAWNVTGGTVEMPQNGNCIVNTGITWGDGINHYLATITHGAMTYHGNGSVITDKATYTNTSSVSTNFSPFNITAGVGYKFYDLSCANYPAIVPITVGANPYGQFCAFVQTAYPDQLLFINLLATGAAGPVDLNGGAHVIILNAESINSVYGVVSPNGGGNNLLVWERCYHVVRCAYTYGGIYGDSPHQEWHATDQGSYANTFLVKGGATGHTTGNLDIYYTVLPRDNATNGGTYLTFLDQTGYTQYDGNITAHVDIDMSGDSTGTNDTTAIMAFKTITGSLGGYTTGISISGVVKNVGSSYHNNYDGSPIEWNPSLYASYSGESQSHIVFHDFNMPGYTSTSNSLYMDMVPFSTGNVGASFRDAYFPVGRTFANDNFLKRNDYNVSVAGEMDTPNFYLATPSMASGATLTALKFQGLGATFTPQYSGVVTFSASAACANSTSGDGGEWNLYYGTGTPPTNGQATTTGGGTVVIGGIGAEVTFTSAAADAYTPCSVSGTISGLTAGTTYWFDPGLGILSVGTATMSGPTLGAQELRR